MPWGREGWEGLLASQGDPAEAAEGALGGVALLARHPIEGRAVRAWGDGPEAGPQAEPFGGGPTWAIRVADRTDDDVIGAL